MTDRDLDDLHPDLKPICERWLAQCERQGLKVKVTFTWRSIAEQDALYAMGRTKPGHIVTNARGGQSNHNFTLAGKPASKAFDFAAFTDEGHYIADGQDTRYSRAALIGEGFGLKWGGRWKNPDWDHLELA